MRAYEDELSQPPKLFTSSLDRSLSNQILYKTNYIKEYMEQQKEMTETLSASISRVNDDIHTTKLEQQNFFHHLVTKQENSNIQLHNRLGNQEETSKSILDRVAHVEQLSHDLRKKMTNDELMNQVIFDGLHSQDQVSKELANHLKSNDQTLEFIHQQLVNQEELCKTLSEKLEIQEAFHQTVLERLDSQEALTQKISRQLEHIKGVIFERFSTITEKLENSIKYTASFFLPKSETAQLSQDEVDQVNKEYTKQ
ncbi:hypothetical protein [Bacillus pinisoli]|uniref:hypothetical protein n=1 Tax=Bacillus pinisoli TaxID=2901866 RepID=UPI001FF2C910|nr:hypothetical protein [Bacillus pinisoli]